MILTVTLNASIDKLYLVEKLAPYSVSRVQEVVNTAGGKGLNVSHELRTPLTNVRSYADYLSFLFRYKSTAKLRNRKGKSKKKIRNEERKDQKN